MKQNLSVLVTGASGYIGSVLVGRLLDEGYKVTALDNLLYNQTSLMHYCSDEKFDFLKGDVRNENLLEEALEGKDFILPLAALVGAPVCKENPRLCKQVNYESIQLLADLRDRSQRIIFPTTNSGYGRTSGETYCTEETPLEPISLYGETKVEAEKHLLSQENTITLRLATVFGMSQRMRTDLLVNNFVYEALERGYLIVYEKDFKRDYVHIRDVADCIKYCIENFQKMKGEPYNVGLDEANLSKQELAEKVKSHVPELYIHYSDIKEDPDKRNYIVSNDKLKKAGFRAKRSIDRGIREVKKGYKMIPNGKFRNY